MAKPWGLNIHTNKRPVRAKYEYCPYRAHIGGFNLSTQGVAIGLKYIATSWRNYVILIFYYPFSPMCSTVSEYFLHGTKQYFERKLHESVSIN